MSINRELLWTEVSISQNTKYSIKGTSIWQGMLFFFKYFSRYCLGKKEKHQILHLCGIMGYLNFSLFSQVISILGFCGDFLNFHMDYAL